MYVQPLITVSRGIVRVDHSAGGSFSVSATMVVSSRVVGYAHQRHGAETSHEGRMAGSSGTGTYGLTSFRHVGNVGIRNGYSLTKIEAAERRERHLVDCGFREKQSEPTAR